MCPKCLSQPPNSTSTDDDSDLAESQFRESDGLSIYQSLICERPFKDQPTRLTQREVLSINDAITYDNVNSRAGAVPSCPNTRPT